MADGAPLVARVRFARYTGEPSAYPVDPAACTEDAGTVEVAGLLLAVALRAGPAVLSIDAARYLRCDVPAVLEAVRHVFHARYRLRVMYTPAGDGLALAREIAATLGGVLDELPALDDETPDGDVTY